MIPSSSSPEAWEGFQDVELRWEGMLNPHWEGAAHRGLGVHALHLPARPWNRELVQESLKALQIRLGVDFLVIPAEAPSGHWATSKFLQALEVLLEHTAGRGVKLALRPAPGSIPGLVSTLKEAHGEAVGFCWDAHTGKDLELIADRLYTAVGSAGDDFSALQRTGYRWNLALEGEAAALKATMETLKVRFPPVTFPAAMPTSALGRPILPDEGIVFGAHWGDA